MTAVVTFRESLLKKKEHLIEETGAIIAVLLRLENSIKLQITVESHQSVLLQTVIGAAGDIQGLAVQPESLGQVVSLLSRLGDVVDMAQKSHEDLVLAAKEVAAVVHFLADRLEKLNAQSE